MHGAMAQGAGWQQVRKGRFVVLAAGEGAGGGAAPAFCLAGEALALARVESVADAAVKLHFFAPADDRPGARTDSTHATHAAVTLPYPNPVIHSL